MLERDEEKNICIGKVSERKRYFIDKEKFKQNKQFCQLGPFYFVIPLSFNTNYVIIFLVKILYSNFMFNLTKLKKKLRTPLILLCLIIFNIFFYHPNVTMCNVYLYLHVCIFCTLVIDI